MVGMKLNTPYMILSEARRGEERNHIEGTGEAALDLNKLVLAVRRVAAQGEDVLDAVGFDGSSLSPSSASCLS